MKKKPSHAAEKINANGKKMVSFHFFAPEAQDVLLTGSFNNWDGGKHPMKKDKNGIWKKRLGLSPGQYEYRYLVDDQWSNDPSCQARVDNGFGGQNNIITVD